MDLLAFAIEMVDKAHRRGFPLQCLMDYPDHDLLKVGLDPECTNERLVKEARGVLDAVDNRGREGDVVFVEADNIIVAYLCCGVVSFKYRRASSNPVTPDPRQCCFAELLNSGG